MVIAILIFSGCEKADVEKPMPIELTREHACAVCGMIIVDFPGARAQVHYINGEIDHFCSTLDMFLFYLQPDRPANIAAVLVNDMGENEHDHPEGHWIEAQNAHYVYGGDIMGPMGEALVPFLDLKEAEVYVAEHGGRIVAFNDVTEEMLKPEAAIHHKEAR